MRVDKSFPFGLHDTFADEICILESLRTKMVVQRGRTKFGLVPYKSSPFLCARRVLFKPRVVKVAIIWSYIDVISKAATDEV
jgi:hypothetical protein